MERADAELIDEYGRGPHMAFADLVRRHVDLVYAAALRRTVDPGLAEDVTQAVFIVLSKKWRALRSHATVAGWLLVVTRHVARRALRSRRRRDRHERAAAAARPEITSMDRGEAERAELASMLDEALVRLRAADRDAIALRYLEARSLADVGRTLGISEEAARKRVARGIDRVRQSVARRGLPLDITELTAGIAGLTTQPAPQATVAGASAISASASPCAVSLSNGTLFMLALKKLARVCAVAVTTLAAVAVVTVLAQPAPPVAQNTSTPAATAPSTNLSSSPELTINTIAIQLAVTNIEANIDLFKKVGFRVRFQDKPDARGRLVRATVDSGAVRLRMYRVNTPPHPTDNLIAYFWIDGGSAALSSLHDQIADRGVAVGPVGNSLQLLQFNLTTPDGYTFGFYTQP
jgi:RNA polymerase sigma factor (sigma-70 family)